AGLGPRRALVRPGNGERVRRAQLRNRAPLHLGRLHGCTARRVSRRARSASGAAMSIIVTVVIPAFKRTELLRKAILSTFALDFDRSAYEVIVVDSSPDARTERLVAELQASAPCALRCLRKEPEGPGPSRNLGARAGEGEFIAFLDIDCQ